MAQNTICHPLLTGDEEIAREIRVRRRKPGKTADELFEDEIWCLLASMGFKEMSHGRSFRIDTPDVETPQIDVFAKDDQTVLVVECTQSDRKGMKRNMSPKIDWVVARKEKVERAIHKQFGQSPKLKIRFIIATRNIVWGNSDLERCDRNSIKVIRDDQIDYYNDLAQHLKNAARYQLLADLFGEMDVPGLTKEVFATRGKMGGGVFYTFLIRPDDLLKISYVAHKSHPSPKEIKTYQRLIRKRRLKSIADYINDGGRFPTNIVVNLKTSNKKKSLRFDQRREFKNDQVEGQDVGILHLPKHYASAWIIDGQHRLYAYAYAKESGELNDDKSLLPVLAYENLDAETEMELFIDINSKQVKVSNSLLLELYADLHSNSDNPDEAFQSLLSQVALQLESEKSSPIHNRVILSSKKRSAKSRRCLTLTTVVAGLKASELLGSVKRGDPLPGSFSTNNPDNYDKEKAKAYKIIAACLNVLKNGVPDHWNAGDGPGGYLCTNGGLRAIFHVIKDVADHLNAAESVDFHGMSPNRVVEKLEPYLQTIVDFVRDASAEEIQVIRQEGSSMSGFRNQSYMLEEHIHRAMPEFRPHKLIQYLNRQKASRANDGIVDDNEQTQITLH